ncbi:MAG: hypothetical protein KC561_11170 [Myxococcales bacterium]|nr:hypothetical protein [Myxococcales bacterium]
MKLRTVALLILTGAIAALWSAGGKAVHAQPAGEPVTFATVQAIFDARCVRCHGGRAAASRLDLSPGGAYDQIVSQPSHQAPSLNLIEPGQPQRSYLLLKVRDEHVEAGGRGRQCPLGEDPLSPGDLSSIERWIRNGAPR